MLKIITFILVFLCINLEITNAYIFYSKPATKNYIKGNTKVLLKEINYKNTSLDYIKISTNKETNLKGYSVWTDSKIFSFKENQYLKPNEEFKIQAKITGTTEQVILLDKNNLIIDSVCWKNKKPSKSEEKDIQTLIEIKQWKGDCIDSDKVKVNQSIKRTSFKDTNSKVDWELESQAELQAENKALLDNKSNKEKNTLENQNNNLKIKISDFLANPSGKDSGKEWVEIYNPSESEANLTGWLLDDEEGGSKPYSLNNKTIQGNSHLIIHNSESKINLNNSEDTVRLIKPNGQIHQEISYENALENKSYLFTENELEKNEVQNQINGDLSNKIIFTEIFPNPEGKDKGKEWLEISNIGSKIVNLSNWEIEHGTNEFKLNDDYIIDSNSILVISDEELGFSLKNTNAKLSLKDFKGNIIDQIDYEKSENGKSYSLIKDSQTQKSDWQWLSATPNENNPSLNKLIGQIKSIEGNNLAIEDDHLNTSIVHLSKETNTKGLIPGSKISIQAYKQGTNFTLHKINSISATTEKNTINKPEDKKAKLNNYTIILLAFLVIGIIYTKISLKIAIVKRQRLIKKKCLKVLTLSKPAYTLNDKYKGRSPPTS